MTQCWMLCGRSQKGATAYRSDLIMVIMVMAMIVMVMIVMVSQMMRWADKDGDGKVILNKFCVFFY